MVSDLDEIFRAIRAQVAATAVNSDAREVLMARLRSLARWDSEPMDYPEPAGVVFPSTLGIAFAVCHPECGSSQFIVDGSSQVCEYCGGDRFRTETRKYVLKERAT